MLNCEPFLSFVTQEATKIGRRFVLDTGEGRDFIDAKTGWYVEDLSGWLIFPIDYGRFIESRINGTINNDFKDEYVFVKWSRNEDDQLEVSFTKH